MFTILHSSAGAGKTHALVKYYLGHAMVGERPDAYRQVLALTFTNKAASEMRHRVMEYLGDIAADVQEDARIDDVRSHLTSFTGHPRQVLAARARTVMDHMLQHWNDVAISTIDSFTRRVVRPFARDLRLDSELRMSTEEQHYLRLAVDAILERTGDDPDLTRALQATCQRLLEDEARWDPVSVLLALGAELRKEASVEPLEKLRDLPLEHFLHMDGTLRAEVERFRKEVRALGRQAMELLDGAGITAADLARGASGVHGYLRRLATFTDEWKTPNSYVAATLEKDLWHSGKADASAKAAIASVSGRLREIILRAEQLRQAGHAAHLLRLAVIRELMPTGILNLLSEALEQAKREEGVTFFSDLTRRVAQVVQHEPVPFVHERLGARYRHFLIDEFQDTSLMQWQALLPLVENTLADTTDPDDTSGTALIVGDAKQAIYRWRNGEVRQFVQLPRIFGNDGSRITMDREAVLVRTHKPAERLDGNFRSGRAIIAFNNALFADLAQLLPAELHGVYAHHAQKPMRDLEGWVEVHRAEAPSTADDGGDGDPAWLAFTLQRVQEALADGHALNDIAVLIRSGKQAAEVARHLRAAGIAVSSPNGLTLGGDHPVELLVALLRFIHSPLPAHASLVWQHAALAQAPDANPVNALPPEVSGEGLSHALLQRLRTQDAHRLSSTLTALITRCAAAFGMDITRDEHLLAFVDEAHAYTSEHGQDIAGFLEHWERTGNERAVAPAQGSDAVQVMTIHKSKGLQFPVVVVPDTRMGRKGGPGDLLWVDTTSLAPGMPRALARDSAGLRDAGIPEMTEEDALRNLDRLNLLYVAFTRAELRLCIMVPLRGDELAEAIATHVGGLQDGPYTAGERMPAKQRTSTETGHVPLALTSAAMPMAPPIRERGGSLMPVDEQEERRRSGTLIHDVLAAVRVPEDLDAAIASCRRRHGFDDAEAEELRTMLRAIIGRDDMAPWFGHGLEVRTEATLIDAQGHAQRPDRVVIQAQQVRVLDIKTGSERPGHTEQVRGYMDLLKACEPQANVEGALCYLPEGRIVPVEA